MALQESEAPREQLRQGVILPQSMYDRVQADREQYMIGMQVQITKMEEIAEERDAEVCVPALSHDSIPGITGWWKNA